MAVELIEDLINEPKIEKQRQKVVAGLREIRDLILEVNKLSQSGGFTPGDGAATTDRARKAVDDLVKAEARLLKSQSDLAKQLAVVNVQTQQNNKINKDAARETLGLVDAYGKLSKQYTEAARNAKNLAVVHGIESKEAQEAAKHALGLANQLKAIDASVGQYQRNVGNYSSATFALSQILREAPAFAFNLQTGLLAISNNMPILIDEFNKLSKTVDENTKRQLGASKAIGILAKSLLSWSNILTIGISVLTIFGPKLFEAAKALFTFGDGLSEVEKRQKALNESIQAGIADTQKEAVEIKRLFDVAKNMNVPMQARLEAVKQLKEQYPQYLKDMSDEKFLAGETSGAYLALETNLRNVARTKAILSQITANQVEDLKLEAELETERAKLSEMQRKREQERQRFLKEEGRDIKLLREATSQEINAQNRIAEIEEQRAKLASENAMLERRTTKDTTDLEIAAAKRAAEESKKAAETKKQAAKDAAKKAAEAARDSAKAVLEAQKIELEGGAAAQKAIFEDERNTYEKRMQALEGYNLFQSAINRQQREIELFEAKDNNGEKLKAEENFRKNNIESEIEYGQQLLDIQKDYLDKQTLAIITAGEKDQSALTKKEAGEREQILKLRQTGLIDEDQYNAELLRIQNKYDILRLQAELETTKKILALRKARGEDVSKEEQELAKIEADIAKANVDYYEKAQNLISVITKKSSKARIKELTDEQKEIQKQVIATIETINQFAKSFTDIISNTYERQKNAIQEQIDLIKEREAAQIEAVNREQISEEEKADKIAIIQATTRAREQALERERRRIQTEQARFDKAKAIFDIIAGTAVAVVKAIPNPVLMALAAALGAAQLAAVASRPVPKYKDGRKGGPAEFAYVGDGGQHEVIEHMGKAYVTPNRATLTWLPEGATVHKDLASYARNASESSAFSSLSGELQVSSTGKLISAMKEGNKMIAEAIAKSSRGGDVLIGQDAYAAGVYARKLQNRNSRILKGYKY